jgi:hypothetical protein
MTNFNHRLEELQPYVMSIRFNKGLTVIDGSFKEGWSVPKTNTIDYKQLEDKPNYYMLYGKTEDTGVDEILDYVEKVILLNVEREMKYQLLRTKKKELEEIFKVSSLDKCKTLRFQFTVPASERDPEDEMEMDEIPINIDEEEEEEIMPAPFIATPVKNEPVQIPVQEATTSAGQSLEVPAQVPVQEVAVPLHVRVTEETDASLEPVKVIDREVDPSIEAWNREAQKRTDLELSTAKVGNETFDLPPRKKVVVEVEDYAEPEVVCKCDPNDPNAACPACLAYKY